MKILFAVGGLYSRANGVAWIMRDLAAALGRAGGAVNVYAAECFGRSSIGEIFEPPTSWVAARGLWLGGLSWSPPLKRKLARAVREADVVHNHSVWMLPTSYSARLAASAGKPVVFTAHGTLEPWAIRRAAWKKSIALRLFQRKDLLRADCIHVNSESEAEGVRQFGYRGPVAVIPNGVDLDAFAQLPPASAFRQSHPETRGKRIILFMARLHEKKGLGHLIRAWARLAPGFPDWHLVVAGPDCGYRAKAQALIVEGRLESRVTLTGDLQGSAKLAALSAADFFVLPSFSEGFSMAVLEAMACGLPVMLTPGCNFREVAAAGAGVIVEPDADSTARGMSRLLALSGEELKQIGSNGRTLVERGYTWDRVAGKTLALYGWLANGNERPAFVLTS